MTLNKRFKIKSPALGCFGMYCTFGLEGTEGFDLIPLNIFGLTFMRGRIIGQKDTDPVAS